jgi:hypothetical protein
MRFTRVSYFFILTLLLIMVVPHSAQGTAPTLSVDLTQPQRPISPYIYGMNWAGETLAADIDLPVQRWGGNAVTRYNWQNDTTNRASDWYFENIPNDNPNPAALPDGSSSDRFIEQNIRTGTESFMVVPTIGWVAKARQFDCGFRVSKYGAQQYTDWEWQPDCGNGVRPDGTNITGNDPTDTSVAVDEMFVTTWMNHLIDKYGTANSGGLRFYNLDNEPFLWNHTHRDVHPEPLSYDGIRDMTYTYAAAIKATDPNAQILGPGDWGWDAYFYSALDAAQPGNWWENPIDRLAHGNVPFIEWYLQQMKAYEDEHGVRLIDYVDEHFYPQNGVSLNEIVDPNTQALRLRSTRALWDPTYQDVGWIPEPVRLIPRMREWVDNNYPGTKIAIGEYNWGAYGHINGALAQADILGIFGREGVDLAALWVAPTADQPVAYAFRMYRNYDGNKSKFGDTSVTSISSDQEKLAIYGATRSTDGALTLMIINKTGSDITTSVQLNGYSPAPTAKAYRYSDANLTEIRALNDIDASGSGFSANYKANSITLVVLMPQDGGVTPTPTATVDPLATPTATPTDSPTTELLANGGFEVADNSWTPKNLVKDKRKCNKDGKPAVAHNGECGFLFTGTAGVKSSITQTVLTGGINGGDSLTLSAWVNGKSLSAGGKLTAKLSYADGVNNKLKLNLTPGSYAYTQSSTSQAVGTNALSGLKVTISMKSGSGKFIIDDVSLSVSTGTQNLFPLP